VSEQRIGEKEYKPGRSNMIRPGCKLNPAKMAVVLVGVLLLIAAIIVPQQLVNTEGSLYFGQNALPFFNGAVVYAQQETEAEEEAEAEVDAEVETILIGVLANRGPELCLTEWGPTAVYLSEQLYPLHFEIVPLDFDQIYPAVAERKVDYIAANPSYYASLEFNGLAHRIATLQMPGENGPQPLFGGVIFTLAERDDINDLNDLQDKSFAAVDQNSMGGWHAAYREILAADIDPYKDFAAISFVGTHDAVATAVLGGDADAGTVRSSQLERMAREDLLDLKQIKVINNQSAKYSDYPYLLSTALYPEWPFAALTGTEQDLSRRIAIALLMMDAESVAATSIRGAGWAIPQDYAAVHAMLRELRLPPYENTGSVTLGQVIEQYWLGISLVALLLALSWYLVIRITGLNRKINTIAVNLGESEARNRALVEAIPDMLFRYNRRGDYLDVMIKDEKLLFPAARAIYRDNKLAGMNINMTLPERAAKGLQRMIEKSADSGELQVFEYNYEADGLLHYFETRLVALNSDEVVAIVRNVTDLKRREEELKYLSVHDTLTGLYNRAYFENEIDRLQNSREYPIAIISADLDGLKLVNDTLGHKEGDRILLDCAEILLKGLRRSDLVARVGGDEFALILPRTNEQAAEKLVARIRSQVEKHNDKNSSLPLSISMGLAVSDGSGQTLEETYHIADSLMYKDKLTRSQQARSAIIRTLLASVFERENIADGYSERIQELSIAFGYKAGLGERQMADLALLAQVYELGKVSVPDEIIKKRGKLTEAEWEIIRQHAEKGYRISSASPDLVGIADLMLRHHENWDGSGYPLGLKGKEIPLECRIFAIVNAYSAMVNPRPYAPALSREEALIELDRCAGFYYDPELVPLMKVITSAAGIFPKEDIFEF
jgi:diguanylate cyclase (GGDEF)-like protein/PAS domain S-box-containing protein